MDDERIIALYWARQEEAIAQTQRSYGERLRRIAYNILRNHEDAEESENETYWKAWEAIPPQRPRHLFAFLARLCRNISLHRLDWLNAGKRNAEIVALTAELEQCIPDAAAERSYEARELGGILSAFLRTISPDSRVIFIRRYVLAEPVQEIARLMGVSESKVKSSLFRTRNRLRAYLEKEGVRV